jgi:hypothetical protein
MAGQETLRGKAIFSPVTSDFIELQRIAYSFAQISIIFYYQYINHGLAPFF